VHEVARMKHGQHREHVQLRDRVVLGVGSTRPGQRGKCAASSKQE
jgi:hypothetical protein